MTFVLERLTEGGSAYFGASKEDLEDIRSNDERAVDLNEEVKKQGLWAPHLPEEYGGMGNGFLCMRT